MTDHGHYPINPALGFPTGSGKWATDPGGDDALWQIAAGGGFWSGVLGTPGVEFKLELALGSADGQGGSTYDNPASQYDTATYSTDDIYWVDLTSRLREVSGKRGRGKLRSAFRPGVGTVALVNTDGVFNPQRGIQLIGDQAMRPGRWVRLSGKRTASDVWIPLWVMRVQALADEYVDAAHDVISRWSLAGLETILEARQEPPLESPDPVTDGQTFGERARYLWQDYIDAPDGLLVTPDTYEHPLTPTALGGSSLDWFTDAALAEGGDFYVGKEGLWYARGRDWLDFDAPPLFQVGAYDLTDVVVLDATTSWDMTRIVNDLAFTREEYEGEPQPPITQAAVNSSSQALYGKRGVVTQGIQAKEDADVKALADRAIERFAFDSLRIESLELWSPTLAGVDNLLNLELGDIIQVQIVTAVGWSYAMKVLVNEIEHIVNDKDWRVKVRVDNTFRGDPRSAGPYSVAYSDAYRGGFT